MLARKLNCSVVADASVPLLLLGETYLKMHKWPLARTQFETIVGRFQDSGLILAARNFLDWMKERGV